jgi:hypothetical protein
MEGLPVHSLHMTYMADRQPSVTAKITGATRIAWIICLLVRYCSRNAMSTANADRFDCCYLHVSISQANDGGITLARHTQRRPMDDHVE